MIQLENAPTHAARPAKSKHVGNPVRRPRRIFSQFAVFIPAGGLCVLRTTAQARAAGFATVAEWVASLAVTPPDFPTRYRQTVRRLATMAAARFPTPTEQILDALIETAEAEIGFFIGSRIVRFPRLASRLLARVVDGPLPKSVMRAMKRAARAAVAAKLPQLNAETIARAGRTGAKAPLRMEDCPLDTTTDVFTFCAQIDDLIAKSHEIAARNGSLRALRASAAHVAQLAKWRTDRLTRPFAYRSP